MDIQKAEMVEKMLQLKRLFFHVFQSVKSDVEDPIERLPEKEDIQKLVDAVQKITPAEAINSLDHDRSYYCVLGMLPDGVYDHVEKKVVRGFTPKEVYFFFANAWFLWSALASTLPQIYKDVFYYER